MNLNPLDLVAGPVSGPVLSIAVMVGAYARTYRAIINDGCTAHPGWLVLGFSRILAVVGALLTGGMSWGAVVIGVAAAGNTIIGLSGLPGWKQGGQGLDRLDQGLLIFSVTSIGVAYMSSAMVLVVASCLSGLAATIPTIRKTFRDPSSESLWGWTPFAVSTGMAILSTPPAWETTLSLGVVFGSCVAVIVAAKTSPRRRQVTPGMV